MDAQRIVICGVPRAGKTTHAIKLGQELGLAPRHTDDLIGKLDWSAVSAHVASGWFSSPGPWLIEGVAAVRSLRKWLEANRTGKPCDVVMFLRRPFVQLNAGQSAMAKGCEKVWGEVLRPLQLRGVEIRSTAL